MGTNYLFGEWANRQKREKPLLPVLQKANARLALLAQWYNITDIDITIVSSIIILALVTPI